MSFYEDPVVDENSSRSEESVNAVKTLFTRKNGFISREEIPDYGVDIDVELIWQESGASSKKFAIQIKSTANLGTAKYNDITYISFPFKTSRLGYLSRRTPAYGLVVMYDEQNRICYFDYVEDIIARLDDLEARAGWRDQEKVNILLPLNQLTSESLPVIHQKMVTRHGASRMLIKEHGHSFNIPFLEKKSDDTERKFDLKDPEKVAVFLETYGGFLFNEAEFSMIIDLLGVVPRDRISSSPSLIFLCATTFTQSGNVIEAEYFIRRAKKLGDQLTQEEKAIIEFSAVRIDFLKGNIDYPSYLERFKKISNDSESVENRLTLQINMLYFELVGLVEADNFPAEFRKRIIELGNNIETADIDTQKKHLLRIFHSETQHNFAVQKFIHDYQRLKLKEDLQIPVTIRERLDKATETLSLTNPAVEAVANAYNYAMEGGYDLLKAMAAQHAARLFFSLRSALLLVRVNDVMPADKESQSAVFDRHHQLSLLAYNQFLKLNMFQNAHEALQVAYEIQKINLFKNEIQIGPETPERLLTIIREIEMAYDLPHFESAIDSMIETLNQVKEPSKAPLIGKTDDEIIFLATQVLNAYQLPAERLVNLVHDMKMVRTFEERCTNPDIEMLQNMLHTQRYETHYASLPKYILRHKQLNIQTQESSDIDWLLEQYSTILNK